MSRIRAGTPTVTSGPFDFSSPSRSGGVTLVDRSIGSSATRRSRRVASSIFLIIFLLSSATSFTARSAGPVTAPAGSDADSAATPPVGSVETTPAPSTTSAALPVKTALASTNSPGLVLTNGMEALDDTYKLAIGDRLSLRIIEDEEDPVSLFVTDSGDVAIPYIGRFPAVGKTCQQLAVQLKKELEKEYFYHATVILAVDLKTRSRGKVYLVGAIRQPGPEDVPSDEQLTLSKAILRAGGFTENADQRKVKVNRPASSPDGEDQTFTVDVSAVIKDGKIESDVPLKPGDMVIVSERLFRF